VQVIRSIAAFLVFAVGAGCSRPGVSSRGPDALVIAHAWEPSTLNPLLHIDYNAYEIDNLVFSMLLKQDGCGRLLPDLATNVRVSRIGKSRPTDGASFTICGMAFAGRTASR
jgi:hypothetical protein